MLPDTSHDKVLLSVISNFEHPETEIFSVRYLLKAGCLIVWGVGWVFFQGGGVAQS